ncbi:MAG: tetratricopeptide repeat protein [Gammaproteobacteria bacterium]
MPELTDNESVQSKPSNRIEMSKEANDLRKKGEFDKALALYRELSKDDADSYAAAGLLHCLRKLHLFDEALPLCTNSVQNHIAFDWYRNEVIWTFIQGKLEKLAESVPVEQVVSVAGSILALEPKDNGTKWRIVHRVIKAAKARHRWDVVSEWIETVNPDELSTIPMKNDRGRDGWCPQAIWYHYRIRSTIEVSDKEQSLSLAERATGLFPQQGKFFKRLEALANLRLARLVDAERIYSNLCSTGRPDWWILHEYAQVLREMGKTELALRLMCKAAASHKRLESLVSLFSDIGFLCNERQLKEEARNHLTLCKYIREEKGWSISNSLNSALANLDNELSNVAAPTDLVTALEACKKFWFRSVGAVEESHRPSLKNRGIRRMLQGKLSMGQPDKSFCFISSANRESYFSLKGDLPKGATNGAMLEFDAIPSFDKKKNRESWKAVNIRTVLN